MHTQSCFLCTTSLQIPNAQVLHPFSRAPSDTLCRASRTCSAVNSLSSQDQHSPQSEKSHHLLSSHFFFFFFYFFFPKWMPCMGGYSSPSCSCLKKNPNKQPQTAKMALEETVSDSSCCPNLLSASFPPPLHYGDFKSRTWPIIRLKFAAATAF